MYVPSNSQMTIAILPSQNVVDEHNALLEGHRFVNTYQLRASKQSNFQQRSEPGKDGKSFPLKGILANVDGANTEEHSAARANCLSNFFKSQNDDKHFGKMNVIIQDKSTSLEPLPLDHYILDKEIIRFIFDMYDEPNEGWENWYDAHTADATSFFSGPTYPYDARIVLGFPAGVPPPSTESDGVTIDNHNEGSTFVTPNSTPIKKPAKPAAKSKSKSK